MSDESNALDQNHKYFLMVDGEDKGEGLDEWVTYKFRKDFGIFVNMEGNVTESQRVGSAGGGETPRYNVNYFNNFFI